MNRIVDRLAKWKVHRFFSKHPYIRKFLPPTELCNAQSLSRYLRDYSTVYVKGNTMHTGRGIVKTWRGRDGMIRFVRVRGKIQTTNSVDELMRHVKAIRPGEQFIVQRGIDLATIQGRPYDLRVMMMRDGKRRWQYAGMVAKVHGPGSVVSNVARGGGYVTTVPEALQASGFSAEESRQIQRQFIILGRQIMAHAEKFPFYSFQSGLDLAVDKSGRTWIIEINLHNPSHGLFRQLKDQTSYKRVRALYRDYLKHSKRVI